MLNISFFIAAFSSIFWFFYSLRFVNVSSISAAGGAEALFQAVIVILFPLAVIWGMFAVIKSFYAEKQTAVQNQTLLEQLKKNAENTNALSCALIAAEKEIKNGFILHEFDTLIADANEILSDIIKRSNSISSAQMEHLWNRTAGGERWLIAKTFIETYNFQTGFAGHLLQKAQPLMEIYKAPQADLFRAFLKNDAATVGARQNILSAPPLYTMPEDLLGRILKRSGMSAADAESINAALKQQTENIEQILTANTVIDELPHVSEEAFRASPLTLSLSNAFIENTVTYTYEEYTAHLKATKIFAEQHPNYTVRFAEKPAFRNIQIQIHENEWVMLSKSKAPAIHFVIRHSKMLSAFQNMILPYVED